MRVCRDPTPPHFSLVQNNCEKALDLFDEDFETIELFVALKDILASLGVHDFAMSVRSKYMYMRLSRSIATLAFECNNILFTDRIHTSRHARGLRPSNR